MHHWCLCHCWHLLGAISWNFTTLGSHLIPTFRVNHSKFTQLTFHLYKCFYKYGHAKKSIAKRISKGQHATINMKNVKLFFEHYCCLAFFFKRLIFVAWLQTKMELQNKIFCKKHLVWMTNPERSYLGF